MQSRKLQTRDACRVKSRVFVRIACCFLPCLTTTLVVDFGYFFGLSAHPGATQSLWQLNALLAGGYTCKYLTLAVFPEEHWNIFPSAQEFISTQTFHALLGESKCFPSTNQCQLPVKTDFLPPDTLKSRSRRHFRDAFPYPNPQLHLLPALPVHS